MKPVEAVRRRHGNQRLTSKLHLREIRAVAKYQPSTSVRTEERPAPSRRSHPGQPQFAVEVERRRHHALLCSLHDSVVLSLEGCQKVTSGYSTWRSKVSPGVTDGGREDHL